MSYETAPATSLLATHCCACGRPLVDAESVERGIGPVCRDNLGADLDAPELAREQWQTVNRFLLAADALGLDTSSIPLDPNAHGAANALVHRIAADPKAAWVSEAVAAVRALGYSTLADRLTERLCAPPEPARMRPTKLALVLVTYEKDRAWLTAEHLSREVFAVYLEAVRAVQGRRYDPPTKSWSIPATERRALVEILTDTLPVGDSITLRSEKGELVVHGRHVEPRAA